MAIVLDTIDQLEMPTLYCEQCGGPIVGQTSGLFAWAPPASPKTGYLEARFVHYACAPAYEEAHGIELPWRLLSMLWQESAERLPRMNEREDRESA